VASRIVHGALYVLLFTVPLLGWVNASFRGWPVTLFGIFPLPALVSPREMQPPGSFVGPWTGDTHVWLSYLLVGVAGLHIVGALFHRFVLHDRVLARMVPEGWGRG
jgi:cytochrome b561